MKEKKILQPGERIALVLRFLCGNCISPTALLPLLIIIVSSIGSFLAFYAILTQNKFLSFCTFVVGSLIFLSFFYLRSGIIASLKQSYEAFPPIPILAWVTLIIFGLFVFHNLVWFLSWIGSFYLWTFYFPYNVNPFRVFYFPCSGSDTCWPYQDVPYGKFNAEFWVCFAMFFSIQIHAIALSYFIIMQPVFTIVQLAYIAVKDRSKAGTFFDQDVPSIPIVLLRHITGISVSGKLSWVIIFGYFALHIFVYSITWPDLQVKTILRVLLGVIGTVNLSILYFSRNSLKKLLSHYPYFPMHASYWSFTIISILLIPYSLAWAGYLLSALFFLIDPKSTRFLFLTPDDVSWTPTFWTLSLSLFNFVLILALLLIATYIVISIFNNLKNVANRYRDYEDEYLKERNDKDDISNA
ncbi:hypothetical protein GEMRC1_006379 [Eukaryota sp. GEM-RC1]